MTIMHCIMASNITIVTTSTKGEIHLWLLHTNHYSRNEMTVTSWWQLSCEMKKKKSTFEVNIIIVQCSSLEWRQLLVNSTSADDAGQICSHLLLFEWWLAYFMVASSPILLWCYYCTGTGFSYVLVAIGFSCTFQYGMIKLCHISLLPSSPRLFAIWLQFESIKMEFKITSMQCTQTLR